MFWVLLLEKGEVQSFSALKYSLKCIHCMCYKCRKRLKLNLNLNCLMHCVRPICRFAWVVGPKLNWGGGSIHFELFKFTFVDMVLQFMGLGSYFVFLSNFFEEFLITQGLKGLPNETWSIIMTFPLTMALSFNFELLISKIFFFCKLCPQMIFSIVALYLFGQRRISQLEFLSWDH